MPSDDDLEKGAYREILARLQSLDARLTETNSAAKEARDTALALRVATDAQAIPAKLVELKAAIDSAIIAGRADLVNSISKVTAELRDGFAATDKRLASLEAFKSRIEGAGGFFGWVARSMPWLLTIGFAVAAAIGLSGKHP